MIEENKTLSELASAAMTRVPQVLQSATFPARKPMEAMTAMRQTIARVEGTLAERGRVLVRWSGTEPKLRVMVEGEDDAAIKLFASEILDAAKQDLTTVG